MNLQIQKLFETQKILDDKIVKEKGLEGVDLLDKKILALQVELGELANEWRGFKFWSEDREPRVEEEILIRCEYCRGSGEIVDRRCPKCDGAGEVLLHVKNPLLEEYVDCLHFILSIGLKHEFDEMLPLLAIEQLSLVDITQQFTALMRTDWELYEEGDGGYFHEGLELFLALGSMLGFTWEQIEQAYYDKNKVNHERQNNGY